MQLLSFLAASAAIASSASAHPSSKPLHPRQAATKITVDRSRKFQTMDGFGFSGAFQRANLILNLAEPKRTEVLDLLFNTTNGAGFTILRNGIGSSVDSRSDWMNTILPKSPGSPTAEPQYVWDGKDSGQLFLSQQAVKYGVKTIYGDAWSAPGFMKTNNNDANGGSLCGVSGARCNSGDWKQAYANYLVKYIQLYQQEGVPVTHIGFLNEPDLSTSYASMLSSGAQAAEFIKVLSPTLAAANLSHVGIICCENTGWQQTTQAFNGIKSSGAESLLSVVATHEYTSRISSALSTPAHVWQTEYSDLNGRWSTAWYSNGGAGDGLTWANNIYTGIVTGNLNAYLWWVGIQDRPTNNNNNEKLILIDGQNYQVSKRLWAFAQYSRTVRPGAVRVGTSGGNFRTTAFVNVDGSVAVNIINTGTGAATVSVAVTGFNATSATSYVTDNSNDFTEKAPTLAADGSATAQVPGRAMISFVLRSGM
ncbi:glycoside hydrolase family 30 protein [Patellaria atrata CBS 101060]|uniref:Glycoside hydrolase family 30 protein n=1 Tax=Patellaria atrata CBS 101060 TaxID=1346257 RepID=A0A9P4VTZ6_9PEZI|nr:glycoside hydrolase family 30 protein [Patellaria atrata CBS 101060]